ncbi:peptide-N4-(N-acetyl-beta-glucosaminyl)asparagine amidase A [Silene latifolia]|uniref:peptide-N4-(N-acetyl-beta- glucosaminyl)asparagine amidase A n=1 Tax=Silene latifolia TaxID=37657 RepID=UPI003D78AB53
MDILLHSIIIIIIIIISLTTLSLSPTTAQPHRLHHRPPPQQPPQSHLTPVESIEVTPPLSTTNLPNPPKQCTLTLLHHSFANTYNQPPYNVVYSQPRHCPPPWSAAVLRLSGSISGEQYDRISAVWLDGVEILRTSTPEPSANGTFWNVYKDVTRYSSLLQKSKIKLSMMLENLVNHEFTGVYDVTLTLLLYKDKKVGKENGLARKLGSGIGSLHEVNDEQPADLIVPVMDEGNNGYWFRIEHEMDVVSRRIQIPKNAKRIVMELYVSYHGDDEFWYSNPPSEYIQLNKLDTRRGNGAFREVFVRVDGKFVGSEVPFPVIFTGGVNPLVWEPVVAIGAFDLPSYDFELTPFLGFLLDGKSHSFEIGVANAIGLWLVDANLHIWLDKESSKVDAKLGVYKPPQFYEIREYEYNQLDGTFEVEALRTSSFSGWVASSTGNFTTSVTKKMHITSLITFLSNGTYKTVEHKTKVKTSISVLSEMGLVLSMKKSKRKAPLIVITSTVPGVEKDTQMMITNITHVLKEGVSNGVLRTSIANSQVSGGSMLVKDHSVLSGMGTTQQTLTYTGHSGCFIRSVEASGGKLVKDISSFVCPALPRKVLYSTSGTAHI